jgi:hypothetical protein
VRRGKKIGERERERERERQLMEDENDGRMKELP